MACQNLPPSSVEKLMEVRAVQSLRFQVGPKDAVPDRLPVANSPAAAKGYFLTGIGRVPNRTTLSAAILGQEPKSVLQFVHSLANLDTNRVAGPRLLDSPNLLPCSFQSGEGAVGSGGICLCQPARVGVVTPRRDIDVGDLRRLGQGVSRSEQESHACDRTNPAKPNHCESPKSPRPCPIQSLPIPTHQENNACSPANSAFHASRRSRPNGLTQPRPGWGTSDSAHCRSGPATRRVPRSRALRSARLAAMGVIVTPNSSWISRTRVFILRLVTFDPSPREADHSRSNHLFGSTNHQESSITHHHGHHAAVPRIIVRLGHDAPEYSLSETGNNS